MSSTAPASSATWSALNMIFVNNTGLPDEQVFITFQDPGATLAATYTAVSASGAKSTVPISRTPATNIMTTSYSLATIGSAGLSITNAAGPVVFVSYAATPKHGGFTMDADLSGNAQPSYIGSGGANYAKAYQPFEITCVAGATNGQGNLTNINYFAAPISLQGYTGGQNGTLLQTRGYYGGTATGTDRLAKKLAALTAGPNSALATAVNGTALLRYIGPSSYGAGTNPYPTFDAYLKSLHATKQQTKIRNQNAFNTEQNPGPANINYNYQLDLVATVGADHTITLSGDILCLKTAPGRKTAQDPSPAPVVTTTTYSGAVMTISPNPAVAPNTSDAIFNNTLYGQSDPKGMGQGSTTFNAVWTQIATDMTAAGLYLNSVAAGTTYAILQSLTVGEITTGLLGGFVGSDLTYTGGSGAYAQYNGQACKDVPSAAWWASSTIPAPSALQPKHPFYNGYAELIFDATGNEVYSIPFSDRFGQGPLMQTQLYNGSIVDTWVVTLGPPLFLLQD